MDDTYLDILFRDYPCRMVFTTQYPQKEKVVFPLHQITKELDWVALFTKLKGERIISDQEIHQIIVAVHYHTLSVVLAAKLLECGISDAPKLCAALQHDCVDITSTDDIEHMKDAITQNQTFTAHIHKLIRLFQLSEEHQHLMANMAIIPLSGIPLEVFHDWMGYDQNNYNIINQMLRTGLLHKSNQQLSLHPMIQKDAISELVHSLADCQPVYSRVMEACANYGKPHKHNTLILGIVNEVVHLPRKGDSHAYFHFSRSTIKYVEIYDCAEIFSAMQNEMNNLAQNNALSDKTDQAWCAYH